MVIISPLRVPVSKKKDFILNLNSYRNTHFHVLNKSKVVYKELILPQVQQLPKLGVITLTYTLYPKTRHKCDLDNVLAIHAKYLQDCLVTEDKLEDDTYEYIIGSKYLFGAIDKTNPRVEVIIKEQNL